MCRRVAGLLLLPLALLSPGSAQELWTPQDVARLRTVVEECISPGGERIAYVLSIPRDLDGEADGPAWRQLHLIGTDGAGRAFTPRQSSVRRIAWTPNGRRLSFLEQRDGDSSVSLYEIPVDGGGARRILARPSSIRSYAWSPDGDRVAFLEKRRPPAAARRAHTRGFRQEVFEEDDQPVELWIGERGADGAIGDTQRIQLNGSASEVRWSPDGERLAVAISPTDRADDRYLRRGVVFLDPQGERRGDWRPPGKLGDFRWSPDGENLLAIAAEDRSDPAPGRLLRIARDASAAEDLMPDYEGHIRAAAWLDDDTIAYLADVGVGSKLGEVSLGGQASPDGERSNETPLELVGVALSVSPGGEAALLANAPQHPTEVFWLQELGGSPQRMTNSNPWIRQKAFARQESIRYRARDGLTLEAVLIRPLTQIQGRQAPLIVSVHGGPESHESNGWLTSTTKPGQVAAAKGIAVVYPNYRGSTGRGVEFSKLDHGDPAGREFDDLVDTVDFLVEQGLVDPERVGVTGGSYGGYASAWAATKLSGRFAASVMFAGIGDAVSKALTTDIPEEIFETHQRLRVWDDWELFRERSPITHARGARTPLLILHGEQDRRVPVSQAQELYRALKSIGRAPVRLVLYPEEGHGLRRAASRYDYHLRMMRWMEHYLQGPGGDPPPFEIDYGSAPEAEAN